MKNLLTAIELFDQEVKGLMAEARPTTLNATQLSILKSIQSEQASSVIEIAGVLKLDKAGISRNVRQLVLKGFLLEKVVKDKRHKKLVIAAKGSQQLKEYERGITFVLIDVLKKLKKSNVEDLVVGLNEFSDILHKQRLKKLSQIELLQSKDSAKVSKNIAEFRRIQALNGPAYPMYDVVSKDPLIGTDKNYYVAKYLEDIVAGAGLIYSKKSVLIDYYFIKNSCKGMGIEGKLARKLLKEAKINGIKTVWMRFPAADKNLESLCHDLKMEEVLDPPKKLKTSLKSERYFSRSI